MGEAREETGPGSPAEAEPPAKPGAKKAAPAVRELPSQETIAAWIRGEEAPIVGALFEQLNLAKFDALVLQVRKEELLPQHWQVISRHGVEDESGFDRLAEVARLRSRYGDTDVARVRLDQLKLGWQELRGKRPGLWTVPDLLAAIRRILDKNLEVDLYHLLSAARDVWSDLTLPHGREQLEILWNCLALIRRKTKK